MEIECLNQKPDIEANSDKPNTSQKAISYETMKTSNLKSLNEVHSLKEYKQIIDNIDDLNVIESPQPNFVLRKKNICEEKIPYYEILKKNHYIKDCVECLIPRSEKLTKGEIINFILICKEGNIEYNSKSNKHEQLLKNLYQYYFSNQIIEENLDEQTDNKVINDKTDQKSLINVEYTLNNSNWRKLGFQSENPRTDFRAGGVLSLKFIYFFVRNFTTEVEEMIKYDYFLFAVVAIKVSVSKTTFLILFL